LYAQTVKADELIIVDSSTDDKTKRMVDKQKKRWKKCSYLYEPNKGFPIARNRALKKTQSQWIVFTDDDCIADSHWITSLIQAIHRHPDAAAVAGRSKTAYPTNLVACATELNEWYWKYAARKNNHIIDLESLDNKNVAYNTAFLKAHNITYDEKRVQEYFGASDDCDIGMHIQQKGGTAFFEKNMIVFHKDKTDFYDYCKWKFQSTLAHASYEKKWRTYRKDHIHHIKPKKIPYAFAYCKKRNISWERTVILFFLLSITFCIIRYAKFIYAFDTMRTQT
jgi:GT2 family glycosyltransferase